MTIYLYKDIHNYNYQIFFAVPLLRDVSNENNDILTNQCLLAVNRTLYSFCVTSVASETSYLRKYKQEIKGNGFIFKHAIEIDQKKAILVIDSIRFDSSQSNSLWN